MSDKIILPDEQLRRACLAAEDLELFALEAAAQPHEFSRRFLRRMKRLLRDERRAPALRLVLTLSRRAAAVGLACLVGLFSITMSVSALREQFFHVVMETVEHYTSVRFELQEPEPGFSPEDAILYPAYLPEGYRLAEVDRGSYRQRLVFQKDGRELVYHQTFMLQGELQLETREAEMPAVTVLERDDGFTYQKDGCTHLVWTGGAYLLRLTGEEPLQELLRIAVSIETAPKEGDA